MTLFIDGDRFVALLVLENGDIYDGFVHYEPSVESAQAD